MFRHNITEIFKGNLIPELIFRWQEPLNDGTYLLLCHKKTAVRDLHSRLLIVISSNVLFLNNYLPCKLISFCSKQLNNIHSRSIEAYLLVHTGRQLNGANQLARRVINTNSK